MSTFLKHSGKKCRRLLEQDTLRGTPLKERLLLIFGGEKVVVSFRSLLGFGLCPSPDLLLPRPESIIRLVVMTEESLLEHQTRNCGRSAMSHEKPVPGKGNAHISDFMCNLISCLVTHTFKTNAAPSPF